MELSETMELSSGGNYLFILLDGLQGRLSSPKFVEKAPQAEVDKARNRCAELDEQMASVKSRMATMEALLASSGA